MIVSGYVRRDSCKGRYLMDHSQNNHLTDKVQIGKTDLYVSPLGIGTWAWGDRLVWGYGGGTYKDSDLEAAFHLTLDAGIDLFDTAEVYGIPTRKSERLLSQFMRTT